MTESTYSYTWSAKAKARGGKQKRISIAQTPIHFALSLWRYVRDPADMDAVAVLQGNLLGAPLLRRFTSLAGVLELLARDPRTARRLRTLTKFPAIDIARLSRLPLGTLGRTLADHFASRGYNPNIVELPLESLENVQERLLIQHLFATHDIWHVTTGLGTDGPGELGIIGFYAAQLGSPPFIAALLSLLLLNGVLLKPETLKSRISAFTAGYEGGRRAEPLFGIDWNSLWPMPLTQVRERLGLLGMRIVGEGIPYSA